MTKKIETPPQYNPDATIPHERKPDVRNQYYKPRLKNRYQHIIPGSIGSIVRGFEIGVTKWFRTNTEIHVVWQRNFYETIIRSPKAYRRISNYIVNNPKNWANDEFNDKKPKLNDQ